MKAIGKVYFKDMEFSCPEGVYMPREDSYLAAEYLWKKEIEGKRVLEVGTGTGFLAVVCSRKGAEVEAVDINSSALEAARKNADKNGEDVFFHRSNLFSDVEGKFDLVVFNSPYLPGDREEASMEEKAWLGGEGGREVVDRFSREVGSYLVDGGEVVLVQSSLTGREKSFELFRDEGLRPELVRTEKVSWEELQVIRASKF